MNPQPLLNFLHTLPPVIAKAPPVIGVSAQARVKVLLLLDRSLKNIFIDPQLLTSPLHLRAGILEAIADAHQFRERQIQLIISRHTCAAKLSLWDVEGTMLAVKTQQTVPVLRAQGVGCNSLVSVVRGQRGQIDRLVLNSVRIADSRQLERAIVEAAQQGQEKIIRLQQTWPFPELAWM